MLITFRSKAHASITMFGDVGLRMLEMMDFGTRVPGAIDAGDVAQALDNLRAALARESPADDDVGDTDEDQPRISLHTRALPLLDLLQAAVQDAEYVSWE
ncbi:MAG: DUF1840 domain-containing protein [Gammaproteobacteria bacterium]|nr:DUF1840 domain-containing protein [Gammaproteobacteria bacterium]